MYKTNSLSANHAQPIEEWFDWQYWSPEGDAELVRNTLASMPIDEQYALLRTKTMKTYPVLVGVLGVDRTLSVGRANRPERLIAITARTNIRWEDGIPAAATMGDLLLKVGAQKPTYLLRGLDHYIWCIWEMEYPVFINSWSHFKRCCDQWFTWLSWDKHIDYSWTKKMQYVPHPGESGVEKVGIPLNHASCWEVGSAYDPDEMGGSTSSVERVRKKLQEAGIELLYRSFGELKNATEMPVGGVVPLWWFKNDNTVEKLGQDWELGRGLGILRTGGVQVPVADSLGTKSFYGWPEIFPDWGTISSSSKESVTDGLYCWNGDIVQVHSEKGKLGITRLNNALLGAVLAVRGVSRSNIEGEEYSPYDVMLNYIVNEKRVDGIMPMPFRPFGLTQCWGRNVLNNSTAIATEPAIMSSPPVWSPGYGEECADFPMTSFYLNHFLKSRDAQTYLMAWCQHAWKGFRAMSPEQGPALFFEGEPNTGKSLFCKWLNIIFGCNPSDPSAKLLRGSEFSKEMFETALLVIDDKEAPKDNERSRWTMQIKSLVACTLQNYRCVYKDSSTTEWIGRLIVCLNSSKNSWKIYPSSAVGGVDDNKWCAFVTAGFTDWPLSNKDQWTKVLTAEAPKFLAWLDSWKPPEWCLSGDRFGTSVWREKEIMEAIDSAEEGDQMQELLTWWYENDSIWQQPGAFKDGVDMTVMGLRARISTLPGGISMVQGLKRNEMKAQLEEKAELPGESGVYQKRRGLFTFKPLNMPMHLAELAVKNERIDETISRAQMDKLQVMLNSQK